MNFISGNKVGTKVNVIINGKMHSKECAVEEVAKEFFQALLKAKADPSDENVDMLYDYLNKNVRIARAGGFEFDIENDETYMVGFNTPVPQDILDRVEEYIENGYPVESITNFWKLLMANPDKRIRQDLFKFIEKHDFSITDEGYMVVYKTVDYLRKVEEDLASFASNSYLTIKDKWKKLPKNYVIYKEKIEVTEEFEEEVEVDGGYYDEDDEWVEEEYETEMVERTVIKSVYKFTKIKTFDKWVQSGKKVEYVGNVQVLMNTLAEMEEEKTSIFTDKYTHTMEIKLGVPVVMDRSQCDGDPRVDCSYGLHVGATKYVERFRSYKNSNSKDNESPVLVCLVNPMHVVAVPEYDHSKMRVSQYYPFARGLVTNKGNIDIIENPYFPSDYKVHEEKELAEMLRTNMDDLRTNAINAPDDERDGEEYMRILESRVLDLSA